MGAVRHSLFGPRADVNVFLSQPPFFATAWAPILERLRRQPYCCVVLDVYPAAIAARTAIDGDSPVFKLLATPVARTLNHARRVITVARCIRDRLHGMGVDRPIDIVPYWIGGEASEPHPDLVEQIRAELCWTGKVVVYYGGNVGGAYTFRDLIAVAGSLAPRDDIIFVVMGSGSGLREAQALAAGESDARLTFLPLLHDRYPLAAIMAAADIHFMAVRDEHLGVGVPAKAYSAMAAGRPLLYQGHPSSEIARIVTEHSIGFAVSNGDVPGLEAAVVALADSSQLRSVYGEAARDLAETVFSARSGVALYAQLIVGCA